MGRRARTISAAGLLAVILCVLLPAGCSTNSEEGGPLAVCSRVDGVWNVTLDYGNGLVQHQTWTIVQTDCELTVTGDPPDQYGPSLDATPQSGFAREAWFRASWVKTVAPCEFTSVVEVTVAGNTFTGDMLWIRNGYGAGYCAAANGTIAVTGTR